ncbi:MAG: ribbon-helix-helix protein, CopG family [Gemmatimonadota bacterium]|nr:ribbon-helix-helix protein, CopG family [Gemmatimonadota bacterium]
MATIKTTVYLDRSDYHRLKAQAETEGRSAAELVREAVSEYARKGPPARRPSSIGAGRSRSGDLAERSEDRLDDMGRDTR